MVSACQTPPPPTPEPVVEPAPQAPAIDPEVLAELLYQAEEALAADRLTYPVEGSALRLYQEILAMDADQREARHGLERIVEHYVDEALQALERRQFALARSMLARARIILPDHPSIKPTEAQIRLISQAQRTTLKLQQKDLNNQTAATSAELAALGQVPVNQDCRFTIAAKNDAQGRWIYRQLSGTNPDTRLRAQIEIRLPASVERLCFPAS